MDYYNYKAKLHTPLHRACFGGKIDLIRELASKDRNAINAGNHRNNAPVHIAARNGRTDVVRCLLDEFHCSPTIKGYEGRNILHCACINGNVELAEVLLTWYKLDPLSVDDKGYTPLHHAVTGGRVEVAELLIMKYNCPVDDVLCIDNSKCTLLHYACAKGRLNLVRLLLSKNKAMMYVRDGHNDAPLHKAALNGHTDVVKCLLTEFDCSPTIKRNNGEIVLHCACNRRHAVLAEVLLLQYKLDPLSVDDNGSTPLHHAALVGGEEVAELLVTKYNCPVDCIDNSQCTPLHYACIKGHLNLVRLLVSKNKAKMNVRDDHNDTPLHKAALNGHTDVVKCFLDEFGCSPTIKGHDGKVILHCASNAGNLELVEILLAHYKVDPFSIDENGSTPLHYAASGGGVEVAKLLITKYKCPVDCVNNRQQTPLHLACREGHLNIAKSLMLEYGADLSVYDVYDNTPIHNAVLNGHNHDVLDAFFTHKRKDTWTVIVRDIKLANKMLTHQSLNLASVDENGDTLLHHAANSGNEEIVNLLITKYKCPVDCVNNKRQAPLHLACREGHLNLVRLLVTEYKADLKVYDKDKNTPLHEAVLNGHTNLLDVFFSHQCEETWTLIMQDINLADILLLTHQTLDPAYVSIDKNGDTLLHHVALCGNEDVAKLLITKFNCPVDCVNNRQQTPLHYACMEGNIILVRKLLIDYKADINARDHEANTPLHKAVLYGHNDIVKCLLYELQVSPTTEGFQGRNILHQSCEQDNDALVKLLLERFDLSLLSTDNYGNTPLHVASMCGSTKCLHLLFNNYQAPVFLRNKAGKSAVDIAKNAEIKGVVDEILKSQRSRIIYNYKRIQTLSYKKYKGAHHLTRIFVVGDVESGKSTLIESLKREGLFSSLNPVSEATVPLHTSGIVPSVHHSKKIGRVIYFDFAGDPEYYSSHSAIISSVMQAKSGTNVFLVVVNLTKTFPTIHEELGYWFSFVSYHATNQSTKCEVLVIGSHEDRIVKAERTIKLLSICQFMLKYVFDASNLISFNVVDVLSLNCRQPRLSKGVKNAILKTIENTPRYNLSEAAAILLGVLEKDFKHVITCGLQTLVTHIKDTGVCLPTKASSLCRVVDDLHSLGLLMSIKRDQEKLEDTLLLLNVPKLTNEVHKRLFSKTDSCIVHDDTSMGVLTHSFLNRHLPEYISIDCLIQLQYCQTFSHAEVKCDHSVVPTNDPQAPTLLYFPALCTTERKKSIVTPGDYTYSIGWFAECQSKFHYFPARFLHVLLLRLAYSFAHPIAPSESEGAVGLHSDVVKSNCRCTMWKNGLHWHMEEGVECVVELVNNSRALTVVTKSPEGEDEKIKCAEVLFKIIGLALKAKEEFCDAITLKQYLVPLDCNEIPSLQDRTKFFDLKDVSRVLRLGKRRVLSVKGEYSLCVSTLSHLKRFLIKDSDCNEDDGLQMSLTESGNRLRLHPRDFTALYQQLSRTSDKWSMIGAHLGFLQSEIDNIKARPLLLNDAPDSWLRAMLSEWLQWAPGDGRESKTYATLNDLSDALVKLGLREAATSLQETTFSETPPRAFN